MKRNNYVETLPNTNIHEKERKNNAPDTSYAVLSIRSAHILPLWCVDTSMNKNSFDT